MNQDALVQQFARIGATLQVNVTPPILPRSRNRAGIATEFRLNVQPGRGGEQFTLDIRQDMATQLEFLAVDVQPEQRHLLLLAKRLTDQPNKEKFLCGHDERHWFVANVPTGNGVKGVYEAMEALKPTVVIRSQHQHQVRAKDWQKRHNEGFLRQGEWFFIPQPRFRPMNQLMILAHEPIRRGVGKPHYIEELYRIGGETVYVSSKYPNGLLTAQYRRLIERDPKAAALSWRVMQRNPQVFARGKVRHPDHKTLILPFWHQVIMSGETQRATMAFLD